MDRLDGWSVNRVLLARNGTPVAVMRQLDRSWWVEEDPHTEADRRRWRETGRDDWSVYLESKGGKRRRQVDLHTRLTTTTVADKPAKVLEIAEAEVQITGATTAWVVIGRKSVATARLRRVGETRWMRTEVDEPTVQQEYIETLRDDWSIFLRPVDGGRAIQLDMHRRRVVEVRSGNVRKDAEKILDAGTALPGSKPGDQRRVTLTFHNDGGATAEVLWLDIVGREFGRGVVEPGEHLSVDTNAGHAWVAREVHSRRRLTMVVAGSVDHPVRIETRELVSLGGEPIAVTFKSLYPRAVRLMWVGPDREERELGTVRSRGHRSFRASAGDVIRCYDRRRLAEVFVLGAESRQYREITRGPIRRPDTSIIFRNATPLQVRLMLVDGQGRERRYRTLAPGESVEQPAVVGEVWRTREKLSRRLITELHASGDPVLHTVTTTSIRSEPTERPSRISFRNRTGIAGRLWRIDEEGREAEVGMIEPRRRVVVDAHQGDAWRFRELWTGRELGFAIANGQARRVAAFAIPAAHSRTPASLTVRNATLLTAELSWIDGEGEERPAPTLPPMGAIRFHSFASHTWIVRERGSGVVLDVMTLAAGAQEMRIDRVDLAALERHGAASPVAVTFGNEMGFIVEVCRADDPAGVALGVIQPGEDLRLSASAGASFVAREVTSHGVFDSFVCDRRAEQGHALQQHSWDSGRSTSVEFANDTPLDVIVSWIDPEGLEHHYADLGPGDSYIQETGSGHLWAVKDRRSGEVLGYTQAFAARQRLRITTDRLVPRRSDNPVELTFRNTTAMSLDLRSVDFDGHDHHEATIEPGAEVQQQTYSSHVWRLLRSGTETEIDLVVAGHSESVAVRNGLVQAFAGEPPVLRPGEVAMFPGDDHIGGSSVVRRPVDDVAAVIGTQVRSLRLGVGTGIVAYRGRGFTGTTDVFHADVASLSGTDVGVDFGSFELFTVVAPTKQLRASHSDRVRDYRILDGRLEEFSAYRSVLEFVDEVDVAIVRATEEIDVEVAGQTHTLYPDRDTVLEPNVAGVLMMTSPAVGIGSPSLMVRTNTMAPSSWFFVHPDAASLARLRDLPDSAIWDHRDRLEVPAEMQNEELCRNVMQAVRQLASAAPDSAAVSPAHRKLDIERVEISAWSLDVAGIEGFVPLTPDEAAVAPIGTVRDDLLSQFDLGGFLANAARIIVRPVVKTATDAVATVRHHVVEPTVAAIDQVARTIDREVIQPAVTFIEEEIVEPVVATIETVVGEVEEFVDQVGEVVGAAIDDVGEAVDDVLAEVERTAEVVLAVTAEVAGKIETVVLDTTEKIGAVVTEVVETVVEAIDEFVKMVERALDWDSVLQTHDVFVDAIETMLLDAPEALENVRVSIHETLDTVESSVDDTLQRLREQIGVPAQARRDDPEPDRDGDWLLARVMEWLEGDSDADVPTVSRPPTQSHPAIAAFERVALVELGGLGGRAERLADRLGNDLKAMLSAAPSQVPARALGLVVTMIEELADLAFDFAAKLVDVLIDLVIALVGLVQPFIAAPLDIPIVSAFYAMITADSDHPEGRELTLLSLVALLVAIPANAIAALALGDRYHPGSRVLALADDADAAARRYWGAGARLVRAPIATAALAVADRADNPASERRRRTKRAELWADRKLGANIVLLIDDIVMAVGHLVDFPAATSFESPASTQPVAVRAAYAATWGFGTVFILGNVVGSTGKLLGGGDYANAIKSASDLLMILPIAGGIGTALGQAVISPDPANGLDLLVALVQGVTDFEAPLGVVGGDSVLTPRLWLNSLGNVATGAALIGRAQV